MTVPLLQLQLSRRACRRAGGLGDEPGTTATTTGTEYITIIDTLVVWKLDRLGRNVEHLIGFIGGLNEQGIGFVSLTDTTTASGRFFFNIMASLSQMERELMIDRTQAGLQAASAQGRVGGRKRIMSVSKIASARELLAQGTHPRDVAKDLSISVPTLYRWIPAAKTLENSTSPATP